MECFPRIRVFNRIKDSFTPAENKYRDSILNNAAEDTQIGRYIKRGETAIHTPNIRAMHKQQTTKALEQQQQQQKPPLKSQEPNFDKFNINSPNNHRKSRENGSAGMMSAIVDNGNGAAPKKFISNKASNHKMATNNNNNSNNNMNDNKSSKGNNLLSLPRRLKPVKGRRATALPSEAPHLECSAVDDDIDGDDDNAEGVVVAATEENEAPLTPRITKLTKISFIGREYGLDGADSWSGASYSISFDTGSYRSITDEAIEHDMHAMQLQQQEEEQQQQPIQQSLSQLQLPLSNTANRTITRPTSAPNLCGSAGGSSISSNDSISAGVECSKSRTKSWRKMRNDDDDGDGDAVNIPTPPPLPTQLLTTNSSCASLISLRSKKSKRSSALSSVGTAAARGGGGSGTSADIEEGGISANVEFASPVKGYGGGGGGAERYSDEVDVAGAASLNRTTNGKPTYTLIEMLNLSGCSSEASDRISDSGVTVQHDTQTPKHSVENYTPQAHRTEGGLIYTRPNLPDRKDVHIEYIEKDDETRNLIRKAIERNDFLNNYMDKERKEMVIDAMAPTYYKKDAYIIHEGDEGSEIFVSETGYFDVIKGGKVVGSFGPITVFGELAILYNANRLASVRATTNARVWKIARETFRQIMVVSESKERDENLNFLRAAPFLNDLSDEVLNKVVDLLQRKYYEPNACIVREGEVGNDFFIIRGGTVTIKKKNEKNEERVVDRRKRGDYFGEQALLNADRRQASVYADAPGTEVLKLDRESFISYLGTIPQLREKPDERKSLIRKQSKQQTEFDNEYAHIQLTDLVKVTTLGAGAFGCVDLVIYKEKAFALKILKKIDIIKQDQVEHVYSEKNVMMECRSCPFIIELYKTFRNEKFVYFLMETCMGGDVWTLMTKRLYFEERTAKFIAGCVVEAFDFLHAHNIIYRDLKPENLMLTTDGYCKLVDFGFAKHLSPNKKTNTFAGTPEYVAPEIILDRGHDRAVDYWALGILIYELLVGKTPFRGQNQIKIYQQILGGIDVIEMPTRLPRSAQNLIKHLCKQLPAERLGYQRNGIADIKKHSWFDSLNWNKLKNKQLISPIKRPVNSNIDLQYFGPVGLENDFDPPDETSGWDIDF